MSNLVPVLSLTLTEQGWTPNNPQFLQLSKALYAFRQRRQLWAVFDVNFFQ
jgi:hypothetical protein